MKLSARGGILRAMPLREKPTEEDIAAITLADQRAIAASGGDAAYGELTVRGGHAVIKRLGVARGDVLYDLGSGASRFVVQACEEVPGLRGVGVELSASRHAIAMAAAARPGWPPLASPRLDDLLHTEMGDCTHVYLASLTFSRPFMAQVGAKLSQLPRLQKVLTLKRFHHGELRGFEEVERSGKKMVEVTWGAARVYEYRRNGGDGE